MLSRDVVLGSLFGRCRSEGWEAVQSAGRPLGRGGLPPQRNPGASPRALLAHQPTWKACVPLAPTLGPGKPARRAPQGLAGPDWAWLREFRSDPPHLNRPPGPMINTRIRCTRSGTRWLFGIWVSFTTTVAGATCGTAEYSKRYPLSWQRLCSTVGRVARWPSSHQGEILGSSREDHQNHQETLSELLNYCIYTWQVDLCGLYSHL